MRHQINWEAPVLPDPRIAKIDRRSAKRLRPAIAAIVASLGIFGGISALFIGLVFIVLHGILSADVVFNKAGTVLLIVAIPMILIGSIFVDEIEGNK